MPTVAREALGCFKRQQRKHRRVQQRRGGRKRQRRADVVLLRRREERGRGRGARAREERDAGHVRGRDTDHRVRVQGRRERRDLARDVELGPPLLLKELRRGLGAGCLDAGLDVTCARSESASDPERELG